MSDAGYVNGVERYRAAISACTGYRGKVAFITGAGSGIGRATALELSRRGADVGFLTRSEDHASSTAALVRSAGGRCLPVVGDVRRPEDIRRAIESTVAEFGGLDVVVANAGIDVRGTIVETSVEELERLIATNLSGVFLTAKYAVPQLIACEGGAFIMVGSDASVKGSHGLAAYAAVKHALVGLTRCMALDHGPDGVRTNIVCPSIVMTPMLENLADESPQTAAAWLSGIPLGRAASPQEVAAAICHLGSDEASFTNGLVYTLDGGSTAGRFTADKPRGAGTEHLVRP